jgi:hypothetical protein
MGSTFRVVERSSNSTARAGVDTAYDATLNQSHTLPGAGPTGQEIARRWLYTLRLELAAIAGGATSITARLTQDAGGDDVIMPDTTATISVGITTATEGAVVFDIDAPLWTTSGSTLYLHAKTNAGTVTLVASQLLFGEA